FLPWMAGAAWLIAGLVSLALDEPTHALDAWLLAPLTLTYLVLIRIAADAGNALPRYGRIGFLISLSSILPLLVGQVAATLEWNSLMWLGFPGGLLLWTGGNALFGVALARQPMDPRWIGYAIAIAQPAAVATGVVLSPIRELSDYGSYTGALAHGVIWLAIAHALQQEHPVSSDAASLVGAPRQIEAAP
ncbi:MAG: hypothetical protein AB7G88_13330, partial [Thermomicrobiales bacterium]